MSRCRRCGRELIPLDVSFSMKLVGRGLTSYYCRECLKAEFSLTDEDLAALARRWHGEGCSLFSNISDL